MNNNYIELIIIDNSDNRYALSLDSLLKIAEYRNVRSNNIFYNKIHYDHMLSVGYSNTFALSIEDKKEILDFFQTIYLIKDNIKNIILNFIAYDWVYDTDREEINNITFPHIEEIFNALTYHMYYDDCSFVEKYNEQNSEYFIGINFYFNPNILVENQNEQEWSL